MKKIKLDEYEQDLLTSIENNEWVSVDNLEDEKNRFREIAKNTIYKMQKISLEIPENDLFKLKSKSLEKGIPYEIIIRSLIHNYNNGKFKIIL